ncbi:ABC transporter permease [Candidatus Poriferisodalis sp.]|uniref:ABC transporter permease n=1 Tax=Candidatus Poriferisodalis sp. TaxID=3101277 RepID=UPI003B01AFD0
MADAAVSVPSTSGARHQLSVLARFGIVWVTLALFVVLAITTDGFLTAPNLRNVLDQQATLLIAASVATLTMIAGGFDVSIAAVAVVAPLVALRVENATGSVVVALIAGCAFGLAVGLANGSIVAFARINSFITTLAMSFIVFGLGYIVSERSILRPVSENFRDIARTRVLSLTTATWISLAVVAVAWVSLAGTRFGRHVYATGGNAEAARLAGVRTRRIVVSVFALSGLAAGLAGVVAASRTISATPSDDFSFVFGVIAAIVVGGTSIAGGTGAVWRTLLGALFIAFMVNGFNLHQVDPIWQRVIQGVVILVAVAADAWSRSRRS